MEGALRDVTQMRGWFGVKPIEAQFFAEASITYVGKSIDQGALSNSQVFLN